MILPLDGLGHLSEFDAFTATRRFFGFALEMYASLLERGNLTPVPYCVSR
jgi:hypothetical protein